MSKSVSPTTRPRTLRQVSTTLYTWRNLELSGCMNIWPAWNLTWSGAKAQTRTYPFTKLLPCGASDRQFSSLWEAAQYLAPYGYQVQGVKV